MRSFTAITAILFLLVSCKAQETTTTDASATMATETSSTMAISDTAASSAPYDLQFLDTMAKHHQMAVDMIKMSEGTFVHAELKQAGQKMLAEQQKEIDQMKQWREQWYPGAPPAENMQMPGMAASMNMDMSHMQSMSGNAHDTMFIDMMIPHHQGAIDMSRDALTKAEHQELKDMAQKIIADQQKEIDQMKQWKEKWSRQS